MKEIQPHISRRNAQIKGNKKKIRSFDAPTFTPVSHSIQSFVPNIKQHIFQHVHN